MGWCERFVSGSRAVRSPSTLGAFAMVLAAVCSAAGCGDSKRSGADRGGGGEPTSGAGGSQAGASTGGAGDTSGGAGGKGGAMSAGVGGTASGKGGGGGTSGASATGGVGASGGKGTAGGGSAGGAGGISGAGEGGVAAGGKAGDGGGGGGAGFGGDRSGDYGGGCPEDFPEAGTPCPDVAYINCTYGDEPRAYCKRRAECFGTNWTTEVPICDPPATDCPEDPLSPPAGICDTHPHDCFYPTMTCSCHFADVDDYYWSCSLVEDGCPAGVIPNAGTFCSEDLQLCRYSYGCGSWSIRCQNGVWQNTGSSAGDECIPPLEE